MTTLTTKEQSACCVLIAGVKDALLGLRRTVDEQTPEARRVLPGIAWIDRWVGNLETATAIIAGAQDAEMHDARGECMTAMNEWQEAAIAAARCRAAATRAYVDAYLAGPADADGKLPEHVRKVYADGQALDLDLEARTAEIEAQADRFYLDLLLRSLPVPARTE